MSWCLGLCACPADTLHRFCKKEHDWGWKKFMELNKVLEGFTVSNTLVIKAQVQVIRSVLPYLTTQSQSSSVGRRSPAESNISSLFLSGYYGGEAQGQASKYCRCSSNFCVL
jgi:hypothetical protein